jgi:hypothetical protein
VRQCERVQYIGEPNFAETTWQWLDALQIPEMRSKPCKTAVFARPAYRAASVIVLTSLATMASIAARTFFEIRFGGPISAGAC